MGKKVKLFLSVIVFLLIAFIGIIKINSISFKSGIEYNVSGNNNKHPYNEDSIFHVLSKEEQEEIESVKIDTVFSIGPSLR